MTGAEVFIALAAGLGVFGVTTIALTFCLTPLTHQARRVQPALRAGFVLLVAAAPYAFGVFVAFGVIFFPHAFAFDFAPAHRHVSLTGGAAHGAFALPGIGAWAPVLIFILLIVRFGAAAITGIIETHRLKLTLDRASIGSDGRVRRLVSGEPLALVVGLFKPTIYISEAVTDRAGPEGCAIIEAHERAHIARGDLPARFVMDVLCSLFPAKVSANLRRALVLAQEQACDKAVARDHAPVRIAETLVRMERGRVVAAGLAAGFQDADIALRVRALLEPDFEAPARSLARASAWGGGLFLAAILALEPLYHQIESLFAILGG